jgi:hypothetical protein
MRGTSYLVQPHRASVRHGRYQDVKTQKCNTLASLPKQVLWDFLDTVDVYNDSNQPFESLKTFLLGQLGKSKWQSYFELLCLPLEMQGLKPSIFMRKLKQHLSS